MGAIEPVAVAILAKAPIAGFAKTRLIPALGADGAAALQARLIERTVLTATMADIGAVTLYGAPDQHHPAFVDMRAKFGVALSSQPHGDLGARMLAALVASAGPALVVGTDCPALRPELLRAAAEALRRGDDAVVFPTEDGGYALIGMRRPQPALFSAMRWSNAAVMDETRRRLNKLGLTFSEPVTLWDIDVPADLDRLAEIGWYAEQARPT